MFFIVSAILIYFWILFGIIAIVAGLGNSKDTDIAWAVQEQPCFSDKPINVPGYRNIEFLSNRELLLGKEKVAKIKDSNNTEEVKRNPTVEWISNNLDYLRGIIVAGKDKKEQEIPADKTEGLDRELLSQFMFKQDEVESAEVLSNGNILVILL